jgi:hypothetical protein
MPDKRWRKFSATRSAVRIEPAFQDCFAAAQRGTVRLQDLDGQVRIHSPKNFRRRFGARDHPAFPGNDPAQRAQIAPDKKFRGDVAFAEIFPQSYPDRVCAWVRHICSRIRQTSPLIDIGVIAGRPGKVVHFLNPCRSPQIISPTLSILPLIEYPPSPNEWAGMAEESGNDSGH